MQSPMLQQFGQTPIQDRMSNHGVKMAKVMMAAGPGSAGPHRVDDRLRPA